MSEALAEGGIDNITVIVADVVEADGTDAPLVLGAAGERTIPSLDGQAPEPARTTRTRTRRRTTSAPAPDQPEVAVDDESRYSPRAPGRRRLRRPLLVLLVLLLVAGAGLASAYAWARTQFYVGVAGEQVAIYQGLADTLPAVPLSRVYRVQPLAVAALPPYYQDRVRGNIEVPSLESARVTVAELTEAAKRCATQPPTPDAGPTPPRKPTTPPVATTPTPADDQHRPATVRPPHRRRPQPPRVRAAGPLRRSAER